MQAALERPLASAVEGFTHESGLGSTGQPVGVRPIATRVAIRGAAPGQGAGYSVPIGHGGRRSPVRYVITGCVDRSESTSQSHYRWRKPGWLEPACELHLVPVDRPRDVVPEAQAKTPFQGQSAVSGSDGSGPGPSPIPIPDQ